MGWSLRARKHRRDSDRLPASENKGLFIRPERSLEKMRKNLEKSQAIAVIGTFDSKAEEHGFLKERIEQRGFRVLTVNVGIKSPSPVPVDLDLFETMAKEGEPIAESRDEVINTMLKLAKTQVKRLYWDGQIGGVISAGGGTGTHICATIMRELPLGVPKVMVSTVASRNMNQTVSTKDIVMIHSVADLLGVNSVSGGILDKAAAAICGMVQSHWKPAQEKKRIALSFFGFITPGAESARRALEELGYEVVAFHTNGTGGMAMEELAGEGYFQGILYLSIHELADHLMDGYCSGIGPQRYAPVPGKSIPRLVVPGGLDCAVLEFTRQNIPAPYRDRKIFFYDFRSAIRLNLEEMMILADQLLDRINRDPDHIKVLIPTNGWSEADREGGPLYDPEMNAAFTRRIKDCLNSQIEVHEVNHHINDTAFARIAAEMMDEMVQRNRKGRPQSR
jgi:uncharacterized protein (UPF0261 family)